MKPIPAMRVVTAVNARVQGQTPFGSFTSVCTDTRKLEPGALYIALRGERFDGHTFLPQALERGAMAAVVDEEGVICTPPSLPCYVVKDTLSAYGDLALAYRRQFDIPVVGITGTVGKTTTKDMLGTVMAELGPVVATEANYNNDVGVPQTLFRIDESTRCAVVEMGMRGPGQIEVLARAAQPTVAVITGIGRTHAEFFANGEEGIADAKTELLDHTVPKGTVVLPADSPWLDRLKTHARGPVMTFGWTENADVRPENYTLVDGCARFALNIPGGLVEVHLNAPGRHLATNAAAAMCVALSLGIAPESAAARLADVSLGEHRLRTLKAPGGWTVIDDTYNAGPDSMWAALDILAEWPAVHRYAVLGDMRELGGYTVEEHRAVGIYVAGKVDALITVGDSSRSISDSASSGTPSAHFESTEEAVDALLPRLGEGDVVLVKGSRALFLERVVEGLSA